MPSCAPVYSTTLHSDPKSIFSILGFAFFRNVTNIVSRPEQRYQLFTPEPTTDVSYLVEKLCERATRPVRGQRLMAAPRLFMMSTSGLFDATG